MNEIKLYGAFLLALATGAYLSWTKKEGPPEEVSVRILDIQKEQLEGINMVTKTQTVAISFKETDGKRWTWLEIERGPKRSAFAGSEGLDEHLSLLAPFEAKRSLGKALTKEDLAQTELNRPKRRLELAYGGRKKIFDVGGRVTGSRDHYVRARGDTEVFLVEAKALTDLELAESRFLQRKLRNESLDKVEKVVISSALGTKTGLHKNRMSESDGFWADEDAPDTKSETLENYLAKLDRLGAVEYVDEALFKTTEPVMEVTWFGENGASLGTVKITRKPGDDKKMEYYASSPDTHAPVKLNSPSAEQVDRELKAVIESE